VLNHTVYVGLSLRISTAPTLSGSFPLAHTGLLLFHSWERKKRMIRTKPTGKAAPLRYRATRADRSQRPALPIAPECPPARRWTPGQATCAQRAVSGSSGEYFPVNSVASGGTRARLVRIRKKRMRRTKPTGNAAPLHRQSQQPGQARAPLPADRWQTRRSLIAKTQQPGPPSPAFQCEVSHSAAQQQLPRLRPLSFCCADSGYSPLCASCLQGECGALPRWHRPMDYPNSLRR